MRRRGLSYSVAPSTGQKTFGPLWRDGPALARDYNQHLFIDSCPAASAASQQRDSPFGCNLVSAKRLPENLITPLTVAIPSSARRVIETVVRQIMQCEFGNLKDGNKSTS
jgi:hypothetical protein